LLTPEELVAREVAAASGGATVAAAVPAASAGD
jgi:hypothetical protein